MDRCFALLDEERRLLELLLLRSLPLSELDRRELPLCVRRLECCSSSLWSDSSTECDSRELGELEVGRDDLPALLLVRLDLRLDDALPADAVESPLQSVLTLLLPWFRSPEENKFLSEVIGRSAPSPQWGQKYGLISISRSGY